MTTTKTYRCGCGEWMGEACEWCGPLSQMVVVEYMPESLRESHAAARNSGVYPHNGAVRVAVERECAERLMESEGDSGWAEITRLNPADYIKEEDTEEYIEIPHAE